MKYILGRLGQAAAVLLIAYTATFLLLSALPGDGIMIQFENPEMGLSDEQIAMIREYYGVDSPIIVQYVNALIGTLQGDFGYSITNAVPVSDRIAAALPHTLRLGGLAFLLAVVLAVAITVASTFTRLAWLRNAILSVPSLFLSIPAFWLGLILIQFFSFQLGWIPMIGASTAQALILPVITLAIPISAPLAQVFARSIDEVSSRPFIAVSESRGASTWWLVSRHTAKNAILPTLTMSGLILGELIAGSVIVETVFGRNGIGRLVNESVAAQDLPVIQAIVLLSATVFVMANLAVDLLYPVLDPRLRASRQRPRPGSPDVTTEHPPGPGDKPQATINAGQQAHQPEADTDKERVYV